MKLWDAQNGSELAVLCADALGHTHARFSPDGSCVLTGSEDRTARLWDAVTARPIGEPMAPANAA